MWFTKMAGVGNDFVVLDAAELAPQTHLTELAVWLCARPAGVGADGLLVVSRDAPGASFRMRMFNPDGSEDMCGNGLRCVAVWARRAGWVDGGDEFTIATKEGPRRTAFRDEVSRWDGRGGRVRVDMGAPRFGPDEIPFCGPAAERVMDYPLPVADHTFPITALNTGSTHTVIFTETRIDEETFRRYSPLIENHPLFPERTSVLWATPDGPGAFCVRIWERGAGETLGCGTGACAVAVAAQIHGLIAPDQPTNVISKGGVLGIRWPGGDASMTMSGPAHIIFDGEI